MKLEEAYQLLNLIPPSEIEEVKRSYRSLAFKLHPDLNPGDPLAKKKFQRLNEAYLLAKHYLSDGLGKPGPASGPKPGYKPPPKQEAPKQETKKQAPPPPPPPGSESQKKKAKVAYSKAGEQGFSGSNFYFRREEVLQDILKDDFARQVFEDIYRQASRKEPLKPGETRTIPGKKELKFSWGDARISLDLSGGIWTSIKSALQGQLDDEQTVYMPARNLMPGSKVRVGVERGFPRQQVTLEVTLPRDFLPGQAVRLKGMGRKIGSWQGDLYLRLFAK